MANSNPKHKFKKGNSGKPKGAVNKTTKHIRLAFQMLVENNLDNMTKWLKDIATDNPTKAMELIINMSEFNIPKLARQELTGKDGKDLEVTPTVFKLSDGTIVQI